MKKKLMVAIDFHTMKKKLEVNRTINCLVTSIVQNVFIYFQQKEEILALMTEFSFFWDYPFKPYDRLVWGTNQNLCLEYFESNPF